MGKRIFLFLVTNLAVVVVLSLVINILEALGVIPSWRTGQLGGLAVFCLIWGMGGSFISLQISRWVAKRSLGVKLVDGRTGDPTLDWLHNTVGHLARQANLEMPEVGVYDSPEVNAFATGPSRRRSLVAVSTGLLRSMRREEIEGVLGHEISHVANGDMVTMTLLQGVLNAFVMFLARIVASIVASALRGRSSDDDRRPGFFDHMIYMLVVMVMEIALGILASLITAWFSRRREFRADAGGAALAGRGNMIAALRRLQTQQERVDTSNAALATLKIAGGRAGFARLFATHPDLHDRIRALEFAGAN